MAPFKKALLFVLSFIACNCFAQSTLDSLLFSSKYGKDDTSKVRVLNRLAHEYYIRGNYDLELKYAKEALFLSKKLNWGHGIGQSLFYIGDSYDNVGKQEEALSYYFSSKKILEEVQDKIGLNFVFNNIGNTYHSLGNYDTALSYYFKSLQINVELDRKLDLARNYNNIGLIYQNKGNYPQALKYYYFFQNTIKQIKHKQYLALSYDNIGIVFWYQGNYAEALKNFFISLKINEYIDNKVGIGQSYNNIGLVYKSQGKYSKALLNYQLGMRAYLDARQKLSVANSYNNIGNVYDSQGLYKESLQNHKAALAIRLELNDKRGLADTYSNMGQLYESVDDHKAALDYYLLAYKNYMEIDGTANLAILYMNLGTWHFKHGNVNTAIEWLQKSLLISEKAENIETIQNAYEQLAEAYDKKGDYKNAYHNYKQFILYRDSLYSQENTEATIQAEMQYEFDKKEIAARAKQELNEAVLKAETDRQKTLNKFYVIVSVLIISSLIVIFFIYRNRQKAIQKQRDLLLQSKISDSELKALRAQMNPHFIFNALNSIADYIHKNDADSADYYLSKFAKLMRGTLENSEEKEIPVIDELKMLELYMQLEAARLKNKFSYKIKIDDAVDAERTLIPPLLLQPFVENSIWHGLSNKDGAGEITIRISKKNDYLYITIDDDGLGRSPQKLAKQKSFGTKITQDRIDIINTVKNTKASVEILDLEQGTRVEIKLPFEEE